MGLRGLLGLLRSPSFLLLRAGAAAAGPELPPELMLHLLRQLLGVGGGTLRQAGGVLRGFTRLWLPRQKKGGVEPEAEGKPN